MIFSILSLALCVWILIAPLGAIVTTTLLPYIALMMVSVGTAILILVPLINTLFAIPFQRTEQNLTPRLLESITHDKPLAWGNILLLFFPFSLTYV